MKRTFTRLSAIIALAAISSPILPAQDNNEMKKISIITRSIEPSGAKNTTVLIKTGPDAENFNVDKYIEQQQKENPNALIEIDNNGEKKVLNRHLAQHYSFHFNQNKILNKCEELIKKATPKGFLGVSEKYNHENEIEGVRVAITPNSGADKAGLKSNDVILELSKQPINRFSDISKFMRQTKPGENVTVTYQRDGVLKTTTATLGQTYNMQYSYNYVEKEKEACLGVYSSSYALEGERGSIIRDFTEISAAKEVSMQKGDVILSINGIRVKSHQEVWDEIAKYKPKEAVKVDFMRENTPKQVVATLKACKQRNKTEDEKVIVIPKTPQSDAVQAPVNLRPLNLEAYSSYPNPTTDMVNIKFKGEAIPTNVSFYDLSGKLLLQQNIPDFTGDYNQRIDVSEYAKGIVVVKVQQGDKVFSSKIVVE